jgi:trans-aconitate 2-methyltransferase
VATQKNYSWNPKDYAKNSQNQFQWAKELIPKLKLQGNEALLDIGCGDGKITAEIAKSLPQGSVVGVDSNAGMIKLAKDTFPQESYPNLSFEVMDARKLIFQNQFDIAFSNAALHWIIDQQTMLNCVQRSLKPKGRVLFQMAGKGNAQAVLGVLDEMLIEQPWSKFFDGFTFPYAFLSPEKYRALLSEANLEPFRIELFPKEMRFGDAEGLAGWVRTTWLPFTERLPVELREDFVAEAVSRYLRKHPTDSDGVIRLGMMRLEVEARKIEKTC